MNKIGIKIKGPKINRFIKRLSKNNIDILSIKYINDNTIIIKIYYKDYNKILKLKSIYKIKKVKSYGLLRLKEIIKKNKYFLFFLIIGYIIFNILINTIFEIKVIHSDKNLRQLIYQELDNNGIKKYSFKKNYKQLQKIKEKIINKYPNKIQWLEIENIGTSYVIKVEKRKIANKKEDNTPRDLIAKKDGVIKKIIVSKGDTLKEEETYVNKGDVIVSGHVMLNEKESGLVKASGKVYAEVWYIVKTSYPFVYYEKTYTGNNQKIYKIKLLNHNIELSEKHYKNKKSQEKTILKHNFLPLKFVTDKQREIKIKNQILTFDEANIKAQELSKKKIEKTLNNNEYIITSKHLKSSLNNSTIDIEMFFAVYEEITEYRRIQ